MNKSLSKQCMQVQEWRLATAVKRAQCLKKLSERLSKDAKQSDDSEQIKRIISHLLEQAKQLDDSQLLSSAMGEYNHIYQQANGKTLVLGLEKAQTLPMIAHVVAGLLTGNQVDLCFSDNDEFAQDLVKKCIASGVPEAVITCVTIDSQEQIAQMLNDIRIAQVATVGELSDVQALSEVLSKTQGRLARVIAIIDQDNLSEVFNPDYLSQFIAQRVLTINTMAVGGRSELVTMNTA